jgi:hypothetical protein
LAVGALLLALCVCAAGDGVEGQISKEISYTLIQSPCVKLMTSVTNGDIGCSSALAVGCGGVPIVASAHPPPMLPPPATPPHSRLCCTDTLHVDLLSWHWPLNVCWAGHGGCLLYGPPTSQQRQRLAGFPPHPPGLACLTTTPPCITYPLVFVCDWLNSVNVHNATYLNSRAVWDDGSHLLRAA